MKEWVKNIFKNIQSNWFGIKPVAPRMTLEKLRASMRLVLFENQTDSPVSIDMELIDDNNERTVLEGHVLSAKNSGSMPFFAPGILHVHCNGQKTSVNITDISKEYKITMLSDGYLKASTKQI